MSSLILLYKRFLLINFNGSVFCRIKYKSRISLIKYTFFFLFLYKLYTKVQNEVTLYFNSLNIYKKKWFYYIIKRLDRSLINLNWVNERNYYFWHFFSNDVVINLFLNLLMKDGKKSLSYKHLFKCFFFIKKTFKLNALLLIKKLLLKKRLWFQLKKIFLKTRILYIPKLLSIKNQFSRTLKLIFNNFNFREDRSFKKPYYKKLCYLLLDELLYEKNLNSVMKKQFNILRKHRSFIYREESKSKYMTQYNKMKKIKLFKKNRKSWTRKEKQLARFKRKLIKKNRVLDFYNKENAMYNIRSNFKYRYELNLISRMKLKKKWSVL